MNLLSKFNFGTSAYCEYKLPSLIALEQSMGILKLFYS